MASHKVFFVCLFVYQFCFKINSLSEEPSTISRLHHVSLHCLWLFHCRWRKCLIPARFLSPASGVPWVRAAELLTDLV